MYFGDDDLSQQVNYILALIYMTGIRLYVYRCLCIFNMQGILGE